MTTDVSPRWRAESGRLKLSHDGGVFVWDGSEKGYCGHVLKATIEPRDNADLKALRLLWVNEQATPGVPA
jgi:hypothetical protein